MFGLPPSKAGSTPTFSLSNASQEQAEWRQLDFSLAGGTLAGNVCTAPIIMTRTVAFLFLWFAILCLSATADDAFPDADIQWILDQYHVSEPVSLIPAEGFAGWTKSGGAQIATPSKWTNKDGKLILEHSDRTQNYAGGEIVTVKQYTNFVLDFAWIASEKCNSGVKYRFKQFTNKNNNASSWLGCEYQILDDSKSKEQGKGSTASLYEMFAPDKEKKRLNPHGQINTGRIVVLDTHIEHWLNGAKVLVCVVGSDAWKKAYAESKFPTLRVKPEGFGENPTGFIMLQDHGGSITFEQVIIREIGEKRYNGE